MLPLLLPLFLPPVPAGGAADATDSTASGSTATPTPAPAATAPATTAPATPAPGASTATGASPATGTAASAPAITATNFAAIPVQLALTGSYDQVLDFVHGLQNGSRLFLVTALSTTAPTATTGPAAPAPGGVDAIVGGLVYVLLADQSGATPAPTPAPAG